MEIASLDDLLKAARAQATPQRLLFVFAAATLPDDASAAQRADFEAGFGGELTPLTYVDKAPADVASFDALLEESRAAAPTWAVVFAAALAGRNGLAPTEADADAALQRMVEAIRVGSLGGFIPFDRLGQALNLR
jgi:hypothetical protein